MQHAFGIRHVHFFERFQRFGESVFFVVAAMRDQAFGHLILNRHRRVERRHRFLVNHRDVRAAQFAQVFLGAAAQLLSLEQDVAVRDASVGTQKIDHRESDRALTAAGFAHQSQVFALENIK